MIGRPRDFISQERLQSTERETAGRVSLPTIITRGAFAQHTPAVVPVELAGTRHAY